MTTYYLTGVIGDGAEGMVFMLRDGNENDVKPKYVAVKVFDDQVSYEQELTANKYIMTLNISHLTPCVNQEVYRGSTINVDDLSTSKWDSDVRYSNAVKAIATRTDASHIIFMATNKGAFDLTRLLRRYPKWIREMEPLTERNLDAFEKEFQIVQERLTTFIRNLITVNLALLGGNSFHNDIKPGNMLYLGDNDIRLIDFGGMTIEGGKANSITLTPEFACYYDDPNGKFINIQSTQNTFLKKTDAAAFASENATYFPTNLTGAGLHYYMFNEETLAQRLVCLLLFSMALTICTVCGETIKALHDRYATTVPVADVKPSVIALVRYYRGVVNKMFAFRTGDILNGESDPEAQYKLLKTSCVEILTKSLDIRMAGGGDSTVAPLTLPSTS